MSENCSTRVGPYPPSKPKSSKPFDGRTYIWSHCRDCDWTREDVEERSMTHIDAVIRHACEPS